MKVIRKHKFGCVINKYGGGIICCSILTILFCGMPLIFFCICANDQHVVDQVICSLCYNIQPREAIRMT